MSNEVTNHDPETGEVQQPRKPGQEIALQMEQMAAKFREALPKHIPVDRFTRILSTAIQQTPELLRVDRRSLWQSAMKCAQDGLLPDGREAALVPYKDRDRGPIAQYMPMIGGIRKKARNSGEIATWDVHAVYENDAFEFELGDDPFIKHKPTLGDRGKLVAVYSVATLKGGEKSRDVMSISEIEKIRSISRSKDGPWANPIVYPEMAKKTVARRHSKVLPMSTDLDDLIRRDDDLYDFKGAADEAQAAARSKPTLAASLDALALAGPGHTIDADAGDASEGAADEAEKGQDSEKQSEGEKSPKDEPTPSTAGGAQQDAGPTQEDLDEAEKAGGEAFRAGRAKKAVPDRFKGSKALADAWAKGWQTSKDEAPE